MSSTLGNRPQAPAFGMGLGFTLAEARADVFCARLAYVDAVTVGLRQHGGVQVQIGGMILTIPTAGLNLLTTANLIDAAGADAGAAMAASTLYYVYVSSRDVAFAPTELRASATAPSLQRGVLYLGTSGDAANWRFVGWVRTDAAVNFQDSLTQRLVVNYYNRRRARLFTCPAYADGGTQTTYTENTAVHTALNAGVGASVQWIANGEDAVDLEAVFNVAQVGALDCHIGLELAAAIAGTSPSVGCKLNAVTLDIGVVLAAHDAPVAAAYRTATLTACTQAVNTIFIADLLRLGAAADPAATYLSGSVLT